jgi:hypothetical protein
MVAKIENAALININKVKGAYSHNIQHNNSYNATNAVNHFSLKWIRQKEKNTHIYKHKIYTVTHIKYVKYRLSVFGKMCAGSCRILHPPNLLQGKNIDTLCYSCSK